MESSRRGTIGPYTDRKSGKHELAWQHFAPLTNVEWGKIGNAFENGIEDADRKSVIRVVFANGPSFQDVVDATAFDAGCHSVSSPLAVYVTTKDLDDVFVGETDQLLRFIEDGNIGLANTGNEGDDVCGQDITACAGISADPGDNCNLIRGFSMPRINNTDGANTIRHLFSYTHIASGRDSSRCYYACWGDDTLGWSDAFMWGVR